VNKHKIEFANPQKRNHLEEAGVEGGTLGYFFYFFYLMFF